MVSIFELLKEEKEKVKKLNELRIQLVEDKRLRDLDEGRVWVDTDFKAMGATSDKMRAGAVKKILNNVPNTYAQNKAKFDSLEQEIETLRRLIDVMEKFMVDNIELEEDKNEETGS